jgi:glutamine synthetase
MSRTRRGTNVREALDALKADNFFREKFGAGFVDYYLHLKNAEIERFQAEVLDWEPANISRCFRRRL